MMEDSPRILEEQRFIVAVQEFSALLSDQPMPIEFRAEKDKMRFLSLSLKNDPFLYLRSKLLLDHTKMLIGNNFGPLEDIRFHILILDAAMECRDYLFACNYSETVYLSLKSGKGTCSEKTTLTHLWINLVSLDIDLTIKRRILKWCLSICPTDCMQEILAIWQNVESHEARESVPRNALETIKVHEFYQRPWSAFGYSAYLMDSADSSLCYSEWESLKALDAPDVEKREKAMKIFCKASLTFNWSYSLILLLSLENV